MALHRGRATSRGTGEISICDRNASAFAVWLCFCLLYPFTPGEGLYSTSDQVVLLTPENVQSVLVNSTAAIVAEFYASWCGHCIAFSPVYKSLARDIKEWKPAVELAAINCASETGQKVCIDYGIRGYPTIKFFNAYSKAGSKGQDLEDFPRYVRGLRHRIIDELETHEEPWPPACPPLEPISQPEIDSFFETNNVKYLALIFEDSKSYIGREVTLDLLQFENVAVRRILSTEEGLVTKLGVSKFPSCYLYYPEGNFTRLQVNIEARTFYSYALQRLPGVVRSGKPPPVSTEVITNTTQEPWRPFNSSRVYMADLESTLHYSLRVELAAHTVIKQDALVALKDYTSVLAKYFPGRPIVMNLLNSVNAWLQNQTSNEVSYEALRRILDNSAQNPDTALPEGERWVGCQGSQPHLRRYPCGVWTLFHVLTVQAEKSGSKDPKEVLKGMKNYVSRFFGCRPCAEHFENMANEGLAAVDTLSTAVLWLWSRHNLVNNRLAGALSEDPNFPKIQWPSPDMCPACHSVAYNMEHRWNLKEVLPFLLSYFSADSILTDYLEDESHVLAKQREKHMIEQQVIEEQKRAERKAREAFDFETHPVPSQPTVQAEEEEEEEEGLQDEAVEDEEEDSRQGVAANKVGSQTSEPTAWAKPEMNLGQGRRQARRRPSIVGMRMREMQEDIVDLDSFVNQHYKAKALRLAAPSRVKQRTLQRKEEQEPGPVFGLGMELDAGLGMVGLQPMDTDFDIDGGHQRKRLQKRELAGQFFDDNRLSQRERLMSMLSIGFSKVDISLCIILYFVSTVCLLGMYFFMSNRLRLKRAKVVLP